MSVTPEASVVTQYQLSANASAQFMMNQGLIDQSLYGTDGFLESDLRFGPDGTEATSIRRFTSIEKARAWLGEVHQEDLEAPLQSLVTAEPVRNILVNSMSPDDANASSVITTRVLPGNDDWFTDWQSRMAAAQQRFAGYVGQRTQAPIAGVNKDWVTIVAFQTPEALAAWNDSEQRQTLVKESERHIERYDARPAASAFESWFAKSDTGGKPPPAWKLSAIVLLVLFPIVMLEILSLNQIITPLIQDVTSMPIAVSLSTFIGNAVSVAITGFLLVPWASSWLGWWLTPAQEREPGQTRKGAVLMLVLYALTVAVFAIALFIWPDATSWFSP
ncbi:MAG: hypothetical protein WAO40_05640 [Candidatus Nanopelagicales bacterium]